MAARKKQQYIELIYTYMHVSTKPVSEGGNKEVGLPRYLHIDSIVTPPPPFTVMALRHAHKTGFAHSVWQSSAIQPTLFANSVMPTVISSTNLPSFTWMSQIVRIETYHVKTFLVQSLDVKSLHKPVVVARFW